MIKIQRLRVIFAYGLTFGTPLIGVAGLWYIFLSQKLPPFIGVLNLGITVVALASWENLRTLARYLATPKVLPTQEPKKEPEIPEPPYLLVRMPWAGENAWDALGWGSRVYPEDGHPFGIMLRTEQRKDLVPLLRIVADALEKAEREGAACVEADFSFKVRPVGPHSDGWQKHPELVDEVKPWNVTKSVDRSSEQTFEPTPFERTPFERTPEVQEREEDVDE